MELLIFSDSHGRGDRMQEALDRQVHRPDAIFFLGDGLRDVNALELNGISLYAVRGNCDWFASTIAPDEQLLALGGLTILATHGHLFNTKSGYGALLAYAAGKDVDLVLTGHTHLSHNEMLPAGTVIGGKALTRPMYLFNPGSIGAFDATFGVLTVRGGAVLLSHGSL